MSGDHDDMARFSDEQLVQLREEFEQHKEEQAQCWEQQEQRWEQLAIMVEQNTQTTRELAESVRVVAESTAGIVRIYEDVNAAARVGGALQRFILWIAKWGTIGTGLALGLQWIVRHFMPPGG